VFGGYQANPYFGVEASYFDLGNFGFVASTVPVGTLRGNIRLRGVGLDAVGTLPITSRFSLNARIGVNYAEAADTYSSTGAIVVLNPNPSQRDTNPKIGVGMQYLLTDNLALRADIERYRVNDAVGNKGDIDSAVIGLVYRFGTKAKTAVAYVAPPPPAAPPPQPVLVQAPPPVAPAPAPVAAPMPRKVTFSADSLFAFDKAEISATGKTHLDRFAQDLNGVSYGVIAVTGHSDRLGPHAYNLKLSARRAEAVSAYLVSSAGVPAQRITTQGVDGAQPITKPGECVGAKPTKQLIACLQPDRRVEIEVSGTR
jgi:OOP family OmpA-OmpF porin